MATTTRTALTLQEKVAMIHELNTGVSAKALAKKYGLHPSSVRRIKRKSAELQEYVNEDHTNAKRMRKPVLGDLDSCVHTWFVKRRALGDPISGPLLREVAIRINTDIGGPANFQASNGWLHKFKTRHGIRHLSIRRQKKEADAKSVKSEAIIESDDGVASNDREVTSNDGEVTSNDGEVVSNDSEVASIKVKEEFVSDVEMADEKDTTAQCIITEEELENVFRPLEKFATTLPVEAQEMVRELKRHLQKYLPNK